MLLFCTEPVVSGEGSCLKRSKAGDPARDFSVVFVSDAADPVPEPGSWWLGALWLVSARLACTRARLAVRYGGPEG
jgi:hypothetical protein